MYTKYTQDMLKNVGGKLFCNSENQGIVCPVTGLEIGEINHTAV